MGVSEQELLDGRRAFPEAQKLFAGTPRRRLTTRVEVGWHGTTVHGESGAFAVVREGAGLDDLIGEVLQLTVGTRSIFVYVLGARGVPHDISLSRRAFLALGLLSHESLACIVEVV